MAKIVVSITVGANSDKSSVAMTVANAAKSGGHDVAVFLSSDGVYLAKHAYADNAVYRPLKPLEELVRTFVEAKGTVWACAPCVLHRGLKNEDFIEGVTITGAASLIEWMAAGASVISY